MSLYLSLGSNQGDRRGNIEAAISMLNIELKTSYKAVSSFYETEPWGFESENGFVNAVVLYEEIYNGQYKQRIAGINRKST